MKIKYKKLNKNIKKLLKDRIDETMVEIKNNKVILPSIVLPYNKGDGIEGIMTDREILLQISKDVKSLGTKVDRNTNSIKSLETKVDRNTNLLDKVILKNNLKV